MHCSETKDKTKLLLRHHSRRSRPVLQPLTAKGWLRKWLHKVTSLSAQPRRRLWHSPTLFKANTASGSTRAASGRCCWWPTARTGACSASTWKRRERLAMSVYRGGHMFYLRDDARTAFRDDARRLYPPASLDGVDD